VSSWLPARIPPLPKGSSMAIWPLAALEGGAPAKDPLPTYVSDGKWLHPLFELLDLVAPEGAPADPDEPGPLGRPRDLFVHDHIVGRGGAFLLLRAGIRTAYGDVVSDGAAALFEATGATLGAGERVAAIGCVTEQLLANVTDPEEAWAILAERWRLAEQRMLRPGD
jgi:hypothetical protein